MAIVPDVIPNPGGGEIEGYITKQRGFVWSFIRLSSIHPNDLLKIDTARNDGGGDYGYQIVNFGGAVVGGNATGLANDATVYDCTVTINSVDYSVSVVGSSAQTFTNLINEINTDLPSTPASIVDGDIKITSNGSGNSSHILISDDTLFTNINGYIGVLDPIDGGTGNKLLSVTLNNGANAWNVYSGTIEVQDLESPEFIIKTKLPPTFLSPTYSDSQIELELDSIKKKLDAIQDIMIKRKL